MNYARLAVRTPRRLPPIQRAESYSVIGNPRHFRANRSRSRSLAGFTLTIYVIFPGLYFVGLPFLHAMSSSMIQGVDRDVARIDKAIALRFHATAVASTPSLFSLVGEHPAECREWVLEHNLI